MNAGLGYLLAGLLLLLGAGFVFQHLRSMAQDYLFPPVPPVRSLITLTADTAFNVGMLGAIVELAGFELNFVTVVGHGVCHLSGPGTYAGAIVGSVADGDSVTITVINSAFAVSAGGSGSTAIAIEVANKAARLAMSAGAARGNAIKQLDDSTTWMLKAGGVPATEGDWSRTGGGVAGALAVADAAERKGLSYLAAIGKVIVQKDDSSAWGIILDGDTAVDDDWVLYSAGVIPVLVMDVAPGSAEDESFGIAQQIRMIPNGTVGTTGNATFIVTAAGLAGSPKTYTVPVVSGNTASPIIAAVKAALNADSALTALFTVGSGSFDIRLTRLPDGDGYFPENDSTLKLQILNGTCTGITPAVVASWYVTGVAGIRTTPAAGLDQRAIVNESDIYACVRMDPVKWVKIFPAAETVVIGTEIPQNELISFYVTGIADSDYTTIDPFTVDGASGGKPIFVNPSPCYAVYQGSRWTLTNVAETIEYEAAAGDEDYPWQASGWTGVSGTPVLTQSAITTPGPPYLHVNDGILYVLDAGVWKQVDLSIIV